MSFKIPRPETYKSEGHDWIPQKLYMKIKNRTNCCESCGRYLTWHQKQIHHKVPISKGGLDSPKNIMVVCKSCHKKLDKIAGVYYKGWQD